MDLRSLPATLETPRLTVRRASASDGEALKDALVETIHELAPWFGWAQKMARWGQPEDFAARAALAEKQFLLGEEPIYYLWARDRPGELLGEIRFQTEGWRFGVLTYSVWLRRGRHGQGLAAEGSRALIRAVFELPNTETIEAGVAGPNYRSRCLLRRLGFEPWGAMRDLDRFILEKPGQTGAQRS